MFDLIADSQTPIHRRERSTPCLCSSCQSRRRQSKLAGTIARMGDDYLLAKPQKRKGTR